MDGPQEQLGTDDDAHPLPGHSQGGDRVLRLQDDLGLEVAPAQVLVYDAPHPVAPLEQDEGHLPEGGDIRPLGVLGPHLLRPGTEHLVGEDLGHHHDEPVLGQGDGLHPLQHDGVEGDDQIHPAVGQLVLQLGGVAFEHGELHHGEFSAELGQDLRQHRQAAGVGDPHPQHPHVMPVNISYLIEILAVKL